MHGNVLEREVNSLTTPLMYSSSVSLSVVKELDQCSLAVKDRLDSGHSASLTGDYRHW